jgi:hypothetical protein
VGCEAPASFVGAKPSDAPSRICAFNEELLASAGSSSDDFTSFHRPWLESPYAPDFLDRAVALLGEEFGDAPLFLLSDPAFNRLVPFWTAALNQFGCATRAAIVVDYHGASEQADANAPLAEIIGLRQMLDSERDTRGIARIFVTAKQLAEKWTDVAEKGQEAFQLAWPRSVDTAEFQVADVLQEHRIEEASPVGRRTPGNVWLDRTYNILSNWAEDSESADDQAPLDHIRSEFDVASNAFARVARAADRPRQHTFSRSRPNSLRPTPRQPTSNVSEELEAVKATLLEQRRNATLLHAEIEQQIEAREAVEAQLIEAQAEIATNRSRRKEMARVIGNREAKIARLNEELAARYDELAKLQRLMVRSNPLWVAKAAVKRINRSVRRPS